MVERIYDFERPKPGHFWEFWDSQTGGHIVCYWTNAQGIFMLKQEERRGGKPMRETKCLWILFILICGIFISAQAEQNVPFQARKLSERVLFIKTGKSSVMSNVTAINTSEGIVLIDAHYKPEWGKRIRNIVEKVFGRKNFTYLIYSHAGVDHMGGSPAFSDAVIVGHENCISQIDSLHQIISDIDVREGLTPRLKLIQDQIDAGPDDPSRMKELEESFLYWSELADLLASGFRYTKPAITFNDRLTLQMGELTLELCYCTPGYSPSDIFIHVPQEKLLVVGDIFVKHRIPLLNEKTDLERWTSVFRPFIEKEIVVQYIIGCHGELMTVADLKAQLDYLSDLWKAVEAAKQEGWTLEQAKQQLSFAKRYAHLHDLITRWVDTPLDLHERNIEQTWKAMSSSKN
jgi:glyoxylase-like metal-dependent hydrolase (beta-lactamase superfamily II)